METAKPSYGINKYGNRYKWTPLTHEELIDFIETKRKKTSLNKVDLSKAAGYSYKVYNNLVIGSQRFSKKSFENIAKAVVDAEPKQLKIELDKQPEKIKPPAKVEKPIYGVMSIEQMITKIKAAGYRVSQPTIVYKEV